MISPEAQAHEDMLRDRRDNPPAPPEGMDAMSAARLANDMFAAWATDAGTVVDEVVAGGPRALWIDTDGMDPQKVLLYFHGGAYILGSADHVRGMLGHLCAGAGCRALSVDYRLAPEHPFPAAVDDAVASYRWLLDHDIQPHDIVVGGDSAGGGLTLALLLSLADEGLPQPAGAVPISPWADITCSARTWRSKADTDLILEQQRLSDIGQLYLQGADPSDPRVSPAQADLSGLPPLYIQASGHETLLDDAVDVARAAATVGVEVRLDVFPEMQHVFQYCAGSMPEADDAVARLASWIRHRLAIA